MVMNKSVFSNDLEAWLQSKGPKTLGTLDQAFADKSLAILIMVLMFVPALPLPTGGITHIFEIIAALLSLEMIAGRHTVWLPNKFINKKLGPAIEKKAVPFIIKRIRWLEKFSRPRMSQLTETPAYRSLVGFLILILVVASAVAPPFTGLDTLPAMAVVVICLSLILDDFVLVIVGIMLGVAGIGLEIGLGLALSKSLTHFL